jgi:hypothetical protein
MLTYRRQPLPFFKTKFLSGDEQIALDTRSVDILCL